jgi:hypothetical protein
MVQVFICSAEGEALGKSGESRNMRWISIDELKKLLFEREEAFYPMHVTTLRKYLDLKGR